MSLTLHCRSQMVKSLRTAGRPEGTAALGLAGQGQALGWGLGPGWGQVAGAAAQVGAARLLPQVTTALLPRTLTPPRLPQYWMGSRPGRATRLRLRWVDPGLPREVRSTALPLQQSFRVVYPFEFEVNNTPSLSPPPSPSTQPSQAHVCPSGGGGCWFCASCVQCTTSSSLPFPIRPPTPRLPRPSQCACTVFLVTYAVSAPCAMYVLYPTQRQRPPMETRTGPLPSQGAAFAKPWKRCWRALLQRRLPCGDTCPS